MHDSDDDHDTESSTDTAEDIRKTINLLGTLRLENSELRNNFDNLKALHLQLASDHKELQQKHSSLQTERVNVEKQYQHLCESWRVELEDKQKQFDQVRAQLFQPRDLELLRLQLLEEVEGPYKLKCDLLTQEAEAAQQQFVALRREHEALQSESKAVEQRLRGELEAVAMEHELEAQALRARIQQLGQPQARIAQLELKVQELQRQLAAGEVTITHLQQELEDVGKGKHRAVVEREQAVVRAERQVVGAQAAEHEAQQAVEALARKARHLQRELSESSSAQEAMHLKLVALQGQVSALQAQLQEQRQQHATDMATATGQLAAAEARLQEKLDETLLQVQEREQKILQLTTEHRQRVEEVEDAHREALRAAEERLAARSLQLGEEKADLAARLQAAEARLAAETEAAAKAKAERASVSEELGGVLRALAAAQEEAAGARARAEEAGQRGLEAEREAGELRVLNEGLKRDIMRMEGGGSPVMMRWQGLEARCETLETRVQELQAALDARTQELNEARTALEAERGEQAGYIRSAKQAWAAEKSATVKHCGEQLRALQEKHAAEAKRWRQRLRRAKHTIGTLSEQVTTAAVELQDLRDRHSTVQYLRTSYTSDPGYRPHSAGSGCTVALGSPLALAPASRLHASLDAGLGGTDAAPWGATGTDGGGGGEALGRGGGQGGRERGPGDPAMARMLKMAALRQRQDEYLGNLGY